MRGPEKLLECEDRWVTRMGKWFSGERVVYRGQDLHVDLADMDWMALYLFGITGRRFDEKQLKMLNAIWTNTSYPDPRIWNNRVVALAGTARSTATLALGAAVAVSEASIYGHRPAIQAIDFFCRTKKALDEGKILSDFVKQEVEKFGRIYGYGRPIARTDERIPHMLRLAKELGFDKGFCVRLAFDVEQLLLERGPRLQMNIAALGAALAADMGFTSRDYYLFLALYFFAGMPPCFKDASEQAEGAFFPLRCGRVIYEGVARREWG
ncbi:MAG: hypothetical protein M3A44_09985 [Gammaproteobacteria bacterium]